MDESMKCECGCDSFSYFGEYVRCQKCCQEYKRTVNPESGAVEHWTRRFNYEESQYGNWEHVNEDQLKNLK